MRKLRATTQMIKWLIKHLKTNRFPTEDQIAMKTALLTRWFFMTRANELLSQRDGSDPLNRALRPADVMFYRAGKRR